MANPDSLDWFILRDVAHIHGIDPILGYLSIFAILDKLYFKHCKDSSIGYFKLPSRICGQPIFRTDGPFHLPCSIWTRWRMAQLNFSFFNFVFQHWYPFSCKHSNVRIEIAVGQEPQGAPCTLLPDLPSKQRP